MGRGEVGGPTQQLLSLLKAVALLAVAGSLFVDSGGSRREPAPSGHPGGAGVRERAGIRVPERALLVRRLERRHLLRRRDRGPGREIPRAMAYGVIAVLAVYLALNATYLHVLGMGELARDKFPAASGGEGRVRQPPAKASCAR